MNSRPIKRFCDFISARLVIGSLYQDVVRPSDSVGLLDWTGLGLNKIDIPPHEDPVTIILDKNNISKIENLEKCQHLQQLSVAGNRLVRMSGVFKLHHLTVLNLPCNSIVSLEGLKELTELAWLNLSGNSIKVIENISSNVNLQHLDLSDNSIAVLSDISILHKLRTLLLHGNMMTTLWKAPVYLPKSIVILSLAENEITDLNEVTYFLCYYKSRFDCRPYVINWCPSLHILDGYLITDKERLKGEWLYSQGRGRTFKPDQHVELVQYLSSVCPLTTVELELAQDAKLSKILQKQRVHHQQLQHKPAHNATPQRNVGTKSEHAGESSANVTDQSYSQGHPQHILNKAWTGDPESKTRNADQLQRQEVDLVLQDITQDDNDSRSQVSHTSLLDSESIYLPLDDEQSPSRPMTAPAISMPSTAALVQFFDTKNLRPATAAVDSKENKYDAYDKRPVRPLNQEIVRDRYIKPSFQVTPPQQSGNEPIVGTKKKPSPVAQAQDYESSQDNSQSEKPPPTSHTEESVPAEGLSLIKGIIGKRVQKTVQKITEEYRAPKSQTKNEPGTKSSIPIHSTGSRLHRTQSDYIPGRYTNSRKTNDRTRSVPKKRNIAQLEKPNSVKRTEMKRDLTSSLHDSGISSRPASDAVLEYGVTEHKAAVRIQAIWRGYRTREYNDDALRVRKEIRSRRAEDHIMSLRSELDRQKKLYEQEKHMRTLELEAIKILWNEVQSLQSWKNDVLLSQSFRNETGKMDENSHICSEELQGALATNRSGSSGESTLTTNKQSELERTCANLKSQVNQLQQALQSVSSVVFQNTSSNSISNLPLQENSGSLSIQSEFNLGNSSSARIPQNNPKWGSVPHSLSPYPSEEEEQYFSQVPQAGFPTPPRNLQLEHKGDNSLILKWIHSEILDSDGHPIDEPLLGYRVYTNDVPKGFVTSDKLSAMIDGLDSKLTYKLYVKAISALGESNSSNVIMAAFSSGKVRQRSSSSDSNDSEREYESSDKQILHKGLQHRTKRVKSPRQDRRMRSERDYSQNDKKSTSSKKTRLDNKRELDIFTQAKLHSHRKDREVQRKSSSQKTEGKYERRESPSEEPQVQYSDRHNESNMSKMSDTFTVESGNSILHAMVSGGMISIKTPSSSESEPYSRSHKKSPVRTSDKLKLSPGSDISTTSSAISADNLSSRSETVLMERDKLYGQHSEKKQVGTIHSSPEAGSNRRKSREVVESDKNDSTNGLDQQGECNSRNSSGNQETLVIPVIDGRKRHSSGSQSSSVISESVDRDSSRGSTVEKRRFPMAEVLEQRFSSKYSQGTSLSEDNKSTSGKNDSHEKIDAHSFIPVRTRKSGSLENLRSTHMKEGSGSPSDNISPTYLERRRISSFGSDGDLQVPVSGTARQLDMDKKSNSGIVAKLLQKLQKFSKTQEESLKERSQKMKKKSLAEPTVILSDDELIRRRSKRTVSGSESDPVPEKAPMQSDSSSGQSDDNKVATKYIRTHRRSASDQRHVRIIEPSPPSADRDSIPQKRASPSVKRHASFHGTAASPQREVKPRRSESDENLKQRQEQEQDNPLNQQNVDSRVPTGSFHPSVYSHIPVLSGANLQKHPKPAS
ncbi:hypothetical protein ScPMuIL_012998 [Solemya velum]